jgi:hypothetical protein
MADHRNAEVPGIVARKLRQHDVNPVVAERRPVLLKSELLQEAAEIRGPPRRIIVATERPHRGSVSGWQLRL